MPLLRVLSLGALAAAWLVATGFAVELPSIRLDTIYPPGGQAGAEVDVAIIGADLDEAKALHFSHPGITAAAKDKRFLVKIAPDVPPGIYDVRVSGLLGVSNPRAFVVSDLPFKPKTVPSVVLEQAIALAPDTTVTNVMTGSRADYYKFTATKGQRLLVECLAPEIDSRMAPILSVLDAAGQELETVRRSGLLDFTAPSDGTFLVRIHDLTFTGTQEYFYALTLMTGPHIDYVFPPCGQPGTKCKFTLFGRNLPGGVPSSIKASDGKLLDKLEVEIDVPAAGDAHVDGLSNPAAAAIDGFSYRLKAPHASNPVFIGLASGPVVAEQEPNDKPEQAQKITPPCEIAGQFCPAGDVDTFVFDAKKGDVWWLEVISQRLDLPTNPFFVVERDAANAQEAYGADTNIGGARFRTASNDPALRFEAKEDGAYRVKLRDLFGTNRNDPRAVYRLIMRRESPDFRLAAVAELPLESKNDLTATPRAVLLRADGTVGLKVVAFRRDGFAGEIELHAEGLPAGITCPLATIPAGASEGVLLLTSGEKPEAWVGAIRVFGKAKIGDAEVTREARGGAVRWPVTDRNAEAVASRLTRDFALAVSAADTVPLKIAPEEEKRWEIPAGGKLEIPLKVTRRGEFKEALKLKAFGAPGLDPAKETDVAADATKATVTLDLASAKIPPGEYTIHFEAQTKGKFRGKDVTTTIFTPPITIAVQAPPAK